MGDHTHDSVPFVVSTAYAAQKLHNLKDFREEQIAYTTEEDFVIHALRDEVQTYSEISCEEGVLGRFQLNQSMHIIQGMRNKLLEITDYFYNIQLSEDNESEKAKQSQPESDCYPHSIQECFDTLGTPLKSDWSRPAGHEEEGVKIESSIKDYETKEIEKFELTPEKFEPSTVKKYDSYNNEESYSELSKIPNTEEKKEQSSSASNLDIPYVDYSDKSPLGVYEHQNQNSPEAIQIEEYDRFS